MRLTRVCARNFKSFRHLDIQLDSLNVLIGANASGKSNFVQLFTFVRDIVESGLDNAISIQGGAQYLRNVNCETDHKLTIELSIRPDRDDPMAKATPFSNSRMLGLVYRFSLAFRDGRHVSVAEDELQMELEHGDVVPRLTTFTLKRAHDKYEIEPARGIEDANLLGRFLLDSVNSRPEDPRQPTLLIEHEAVRSMRALNGLKSIAAYDIDPKGPKAGAFFVKSELEPNADNLAIALSRILSEDQNRRKLLNLLSDVLPFADGLDTQQMQDSTLFFNMREKFAREPMPASFLSDGTIDIVALIVILYFERKSFVIIEEPERNLHPSLISRLVELFKDASRLKQIVVSTHNPEIVRYAEPGQLILISRDASGSSHAERPADKAQVQRFLSEEISMHELYVQNLLEA
ncbi:MAG: AAA family ATPase [Bryobacteraceae bacterium]|jgi:predicted ATPase